MEKLPIYEAKISDEWDGIEAIALVDLPAVESNFMAFKKDKPKMMYSVQNEEQHVIFGVLMRAEFPIYRIGASGYEYYIIYHKDTVRQMAQKMLKDGVQNSFNVMHDPDMPIEGIECFQIFLKDTQKGISPANFDDIEDGSLFGAFKVTNEAVWQAIKDGTFKGFSIEGYFTVEETEIQKNNKQNNKYKSMNNKIKDALRKLLAEFGEIETNNGVLSFDGEEIEVGMEVFIDGEVAADGEYETEDKVIVVADGKVAEVREKEAPEAEPEAEETPAETETEVEGEEIETPAEGETVEEVAEEVATETAEEVVEENTRDLYAEIDALRAEINVLKDAIAEIQGKPIDPPVSEEFEAIETREKGKSKIEQRMAYLRK